MYIQRDGEAGEWRAHTPSNNRVKHDYLRFVYIVCVCSTSHIHLSAAILMYAYRCKPEPHASTMHLPNIYACMSACACVYIVYGVVLTKYVSCRIYYMYTYLSSFRSGCSVYIYIIFTCTIYIYLYSIYCI